jgi:hypothetical protein
MTALDIDAIKATLTLWGSGDDEPQRGEVVPAQTIIRVANHGLALVAEVERLEAVLTEALGRVRASSIPLGMSEQQFNAATILDTAKILSRPAVERTSDSSSTGGQL